MKKALFILAATAAAATSSFAQGYVSFQNGTATKVSVNSAPGGTVFTAIPTTSVYYFALFYSASATTVNGSASGIVGSAPVTAAAGWSLDSGVLGINTSRAGLFSDETYVAPNTGTQTSVPLAANSTGEFVVLGWSANIGSTVQSVETFLSGGGVPSGFVGESPVGAATVSAGAPSPVGGIFGAAPAITGFSLGEVVVPEPTSIALGVMGGLSLLALRRKKA